MAGKYDVLRQDGLMAWVSAETKAEASSRVVQKPEDTSAQLYRSPGDDHPEKPRTLEKDGLIALVSPKTREQMVKEEKAPVNLRRQRPRGMEM